MTQSSNRVAPTRPIRPVPIRPGHLLDTCGFRQLASDYTCPAPTMISIRRETPSTQESRPEKCQLHRTNTETASRAVSLVDGDHMHPSEERQSQYLLSTDMLR